ncbi:MAG: T9SS type A sorting domain-containing protein [Chitinophagales bacterium]
MRSFSLSEYGLFGVIFLQMQDAQAAVQYTDVEPDVVLDGDYDTFVLDVDMDGINDFRLKHLAGSYFTDWYDLRIFDALFAEDLDNSNWIAGNYFTVGSAAYSSFITYRPYAIPYGYPIGVMLSFQSHWSQLMDAAIFTSAGDLFAYEGHWNGSEEAFLGFRIRRDALYYYGWIRVAVADSARSMTIRDYAIETTPNQAIRAGDIPGTTSISTSGQADVSIFCNGSDIFIQTAFMETMREATFQLVDMNGKIVLQKQLEPGDQMIYTDLPAGLYIAQYTTGEVGITKKIALL